VQLDLVGKTAVRLTLKVEEELATRCRSRRDALAVSFQASLLDPKQVYGPLGISQAQFSKILTGTQNPDPELFYPWMAACGNLIPFRFDALQLKHSITPIQSNLEQENERLRRELDDERRVVRRLGEMLRGAA